MWLRLFSIATIVTFQAFLIIDVKAGVPFRGDMVEPIPPEVDDEYASDYEPQNENPIPPEHLGEDTVDNDGDDSSSDGSPRVSDDENALDSDDDPTPGDEGSENEEGSRVGRRRVIQFENINNEIGPIYITDHPQRRSNHT
ncbi:hypothetical protein TKK_0011377 [Trichogramma kaykai]|uniref:Secreted protein n=1 Tax=Trichogramma kaykai TaxID=54128 RepID=A0ABD2WS21_9HYME